MGRIIDTFLDRNTPVEAWRLGAVVPAAYGQSLIQWKSYADITAGVGPDLALSLLLDDFRDRGGENDSPVTSHLWVAKRIRRALVSSH